jgi:putative DNA primase/helicase
MKQSALVYAARGWHVHPLWPNTKKPILTDWPSKATTDPQQITDWWSTYPQANIGIVCGKVSGFFAVDVDCKGAHNGVKLMCELEAEHGYLETTKVGTPSGGCHYYCTYDETLGFGNMQGKIPGVDIKTDRGYVVAPPSVLDGKPYFWLSDGETHPAPEWLLKLLLSNGMKAGASATAPLSPMVSEGSRNTTLFKRACGMRQLGMEEPEMLERVVALNETVVYPPLPLDEVKRLVKSAASYDSDFRMTDLGNAQRLVGLYGDNLRYIPAFKGWLVWDGQIWRRDENGQVERYAKETIEFLFRRAVMRPDSPARSKLINFSLASHNNHKLYAMVKLAQTETEVAMMTPADLDADGFKLAVANGVVDLRTGELGPFQRSDFITHQVPIAYDAEATCPRWLEFIRQCTGDDEELGAYLQQVCGYALTGATKEQCLFIILGPGANGKSTFLSILQRLVGPYAMTMPGSTFMRGREKAIPNDLAAMKGKRLVLTSELEEGSSFSEVLLKNMTGQDRISCRYLYGEYFEYVPQFKIVIAANHLPNIEGVEEAIWRRLRIVPFEVTVPPQQRDTLLLEKLENELSGILNWAIAGCTAWQKAGRLKIPSRVDDSVRRYRMETDKIEQWVQTRCQPALDGQALIKELFEDYVNWCKAENVPIHKKEVFIRAMVAKGYQKHRGAKGQMFLCGVTLMR